MTRVNGCRPLRGLGALVDHLTQGVALGYYIFAPYGATSKSGSSIRRVWN